MKWLIIIVIALLLLLGAFFVFRGKQATAPTDNSNTAAGITNEQAANDPTGISADILALEKARDERRLIDIRALQTALESYKIDHEGVYPMALNQLAPDYLGVVPSDPKTGEPYAYTPTGEGPDFYGIVYTLETGVNGLEAKTYTATPGSTISP